MTTDCLLHALTARYVNIARVLTDGDGGQRSPSRHGTPRATDQAAQAPAAETDRKAVADQGTGAPAEHASGGGHGGALMRCAANGHTWVVYNYLS